VMRGAYEWLVYVTGMVKEREKILSKYSNIWIKLLSWTIWQSIDWLRLHISIWLVLELVWNLCDIYVEH
jgi:hypothetical protein